MKKILLVILCLFCLFCKAQNMSFLGVPMCTKASSFKQELLLKDGFRDHPLPYEHIHGVEGYFAGMRASISIVSTIKSDLVYSVVVSFDDLNFDINDDNAIQKQKFQEDMFDFIKMKLINKYGEPIENTFRDDNYLEWLNWKTKEGDVDLIIVQYIDDMTYRQIQIVYTDDIAKRINRAEEDSDW